MSIAALFGGSPLTFAIAAVCIIVTYYAYFVVRWYARIRKIGREVDKLPGDKKGFLGNIRQHPGINGKTLPWMLDVNRRHGGYVHRLWFGPFRPAVVLCHPDVVKLILKTAEPKATKDNGAYQLLRPWLGDGLLVSSGEKWFRNRRMLTPAFHFDILKPYVQVYNEAADVLLKKWTKTLEQNGPDASIEIFGPVSLCTLDIILRCAFSYNANIQETWTNDVYVTYVMSLTQMILQRAFKIHWYVDWIYYRTSHGKSFASKCDYVHEIADKIIKQRKEALAKDPNISKKRNMDFLDILLLAKDDAGSGLTDIEMRNEVDTFLFEGHDTTASAVSWCLYNLASHPDIQEKAQLELDALVQDRDNDNLTWDDIGQLSYLTMCVKESLRLHPPVPFVGRELESPLQVNGVTLLPGTLVDVVIYAVHHNELVWGEDHMEYKPERFEPDKVKNMDSYAFIPFSAGPRNCIGQLFALHEVKVVVAKILLKYKLEVDKSHPLEIMPEVVLRARDGIKLFFTSRK